MTSGFVVTSNLPPVLSQDSDFLQPPRRASSPCSRDRACRDSARATNRPIGLGRGMHHGGDRHLRGTAVVTVAGVSQPPRSSRCSPRSGEGPRRCRTAARLAASRTIVSIKRDPADLDPAYRSRSRLVPRLPDSSGRRWAPSSLIAGKSARTAHTFARGAAIFLDFFGMVSSSRSVIGDLHAMAGRFPELDPAREVWLPRGPPPRVRCRGWSAGT